MDMAVHRYISHDDDLCYENRIEQCQTSLIYTTATRNAEGIKVKGNSKEGRKEWAGWVEGMAAVDVPKRVWEMLELVVGWERVMQHGEGNGNEVDGASYQSTKLVQNEGK